MNTIYLHETKLSNYPSMDRALEWLSEQGIPHKQLTDHQIKIGRHISWYPVTGAICLDGPKPRYPERGRQALAKLLRLREEDL